MIARYKTQRHVPFSNPLMFAESISLKSSEAKQNDFAFGSQISLTINASHEVTLPLFHQHRSAKKRILGHEI
jgi:hypothetical protein